MPKNLGAVLFNGTDADLLALNGAMADRAGQIVPVYTARPGGAYPLDGLVRERSISINTTAAGGNAHLMTIG